MTDMITEVRMLLYALGSMYIGSFIVASALYLAGAQPLTVVLGATLCGAILYTAICLICTPRIQRLVEVTEDLEND